MSNLCRSDSNSSLKERLKTTPGIMEESFLQREMQSFLKLKRTNSIESVDSMQETRVQKPPIKPKPVNGVSPKSQQHASSQEAPGQSQSGHKRPLSDPRSRRREAQMKRFASPDSSHDSAVEMDNGSCTVGSFLGHHLWS